MSREMTNSEAISNLNHIYGIVSPDIQKSLDVAIKALEEKSQDIPTFNRSELEKALEYWYSHIEKDNEEQEDAVWVAINTIRYCIVNYSEYHN